MPGLPPMIKRFVWLGLFLSLAQPAAAAVRLVRYGFTVRNLSPRPLSRGVLWVRGPVAETSYQKCLGLDASREFELLHDEAGNQAMRFVFTALPPYAVRIVRVEARVDMRPEGKDIPVEAGAFLGPEEFVETGAPAIVEAAARFSNGDPLARAGNIFQWVAAGVGYSGFSGEERGALFALENRSGDCSEFRDLFVALARATGIPARRVSGYVVPNDMIPKPGNWHDWAEFRHQGRWEIADPQQKVFMKRPQDYLAFRIFAGKPSEIPPFARFRAEGEGLRARMN